MSSMIGSLCTVKDKLPEPMEASATESSLNESKGELTVVSFSTLVDLRLSCSQVLREVLQTQLN